MTHVHVDTKKCQRYGQCALEAPSVFELDASDTLHWRATVDASEREDLERAIDICPMQAISVDE